MSIHIASDHLVCCAPLSTMPQLKRPYEKSTEECLAAIADATPEVPLHQLTEKDPCAKVTICQQQDKAKAPTRLKLLAVNQSLDYLLKIKLVDCEPPIPLRPPSSAETRCYKTVNGVERAYYWNKTTKESCWQCTVDESNMIRLSSLSDEGETGAILGLMDAGLACMVHRDTMHKMHREEMLAVQSVDEINLAMQQTMLIMKAEHAPWGGGMFGRRLRESYALVEQLPLPHVLIDICGAGILQDLGMDPATDQEGIKQVLVDFARSGVRSAGSGHHKMGRWCDWLDTFHGLAKCWHIKLFFYLFAYACEGVCPFKALAGHLVKVKGKDEDHGIISRVLRVPYLHLFGNLCFIPLERSILSAKCLKKNGFSMNVLRYWSTQSAWPMQKQQCIACNLSEHSSWWRCEFLRTENCKLAFKKIMM